jgi:hypothetical protein
MTAKSQEIYLMDLERASGIKYNHARFILDLLHLPYKLKQPRYDVSDKEESLIVKFLAKTELSELDIAHFVKRKYNVVRDVKKRNSISGRKPKYVKKFGSDKQRMTLTYRMASEMIECFDAGFDFYEMAEYTGCHPLFGVYISKLRDEAEQKILKQLRKVYPKIKAPYIK